MFVFRQCCQNSPFSTQQQSSHWHLSTGNISITQHSNHGHTIDITKPHSRAHYRYHKARPREIYRYHKARLPDNLSISQSPTQGQSIDITKPEPRALYRYHKAQFKGQSIDKTNPQSRALYRYDKARHKGKLSASQNRKQEECIDITMPE